MENLTMENTRNTEKENLTMENTRNTEKEMNSSNGSTGTEKSDQKCQVEFEPIELAELESQQYEEPKTKLTKLPIGRIRTIIKTDPDINLINQEAIFLVTKATVSFIKDSA